MICSSSPDSISTCNWQMEEDSEQLSDINYVKAFCTFGFSSSLKSHFLTWAGRGGGRWWLFQQICQKLVHSVHGRTFLSSFSSGILTIFRYPTGALWHSTWSGLSWSALMLDFVEEEAQGSELSMQCPAGPPVQSCPLRPARKFKYSFWYWCIEGCKPWAGAENSTPETK